MFLANDNLGHLLAQEAQPAGAVPDLLVDGLNGNEGILALLLTGGGSWRRRNDYRVRLSGHEDSLSWEKGNIIADPSAIKIKIAVKHIPRDLI
jgi:hypothetical protein